MREGKLITLEKAIRKLTSLPARNLLFDRRRMPKELVFADVVVFDPKTVAARASYQQPHQYAVGVKYVSVNGQTVLNAGQRTGADAGTLWSPGKALRSRDGAN